MADRQSSARLDGRSGQRPAGKPSRSGSTAGEPSGTGARALQLEALTVATQTTASDDLKERRSALGVRLPCRPDRLSDARLRDPRNHENGAALRGVAPVSITAGRPSWPARLAGPAGRPGRPGCAVPAMREFDRRTGAGAEDDRL